jgi:Carboxypeptidase regulatory-like domain
MRSLPSSLAILPLAVGAVSQLGAQSGVSGVVQDSASGAPMSNVQVVLTHDTASPRWDSLPSQLYRLTGLQGRFSLADIPAGTYLLHARFIGYKALAIPVKIRPGREDSVVVRMAPVCVGVCWPDPVKLAYARSHRDQWGCQLDDPQAIESTRMGWVRRLAEDPLPLPHSAGVPRQLPRDPAQLDRMVRHVNDRTRCRRAGRAYDQAFGATDTHFLVYEAGPFLLVSNSWGSDDLVLDRGYRLLIQFVLE